MRARFPVRTRENTASQTTPPDTCDKQESALERNVLMKRISLPHSDLSVSAFCMGCMPFGARIHGEDIDRLVDRFREAGGNFFDTAHCYSFWRDCNDGASERALGRYIRDRACRDRVIVATKGAHPPADNYRRVEQYMSAGRIAADIDDSLARLQTDVIDLYWLHRDDPRLQAGEILDILNAEVERGRIRCFGGSNWTSQRLAEANRYADEHGIRGFVASQPRWSLLSYPAMTEAERLEPAVLLHADNGDRKWHEEARFPMIPYGPTGNGFFAREGAGPEKFRNDENIARSERVSILAGELGTTPNQIALAWLMHQPFPVVPILGTSRVDHLEDALGSASVSLTADQMTWLETGKKLAQ